jgi:hypothetical protein
MPDLWYDVDIDLAEVPVNIFPLTDDTDFKSIEAGVTWDQAGMDLNWNFVTTAGAYTQTNVVPTNAGVHDWTNEGHGMYAIEIPAAGGTINNATEGFGWFEGFATGVLPWRGPVIGFRAAAINNSLVDGATVDVNVTAMANDVITAAAVHDAGSFVVGALSITNQLDAGNVVIDSTAAVTGEVSIGNGIVVTCSTGGKSAAKLTGGAASGIGIEVIGTGTGQGVIATGGGTSGTGVAIVGGLPNGPGFYMRGSGSGSGFRADGGDGSGVGVIVNGGATDGNAITISKAGTGYDIDADIHGTIDTATTVTGMATAIELAKVPKSDGAVTWNATALGSIQTEANDALVANNLDHFMKTPVADITKLGDGGGNEVPDSTVLSLMLCKGTDTDTFNHTTDSLEALNEDTDNTLTALTEIKGVGWTTQTLVAIKAAIDAIDVSGIADAVCNEDMTGHVAANSLGAYLRATYALATGRLKIDDVAKQLILYMPDGVTELARWNIYNSAGALASTNVFDRQRT